VDWAEQAARIARSVFPDARVWLFGSRATGRASAGSDIDLLIDIGRPMTLAERAELSMAFEESELPYRVDFVDAQHADPQFLQAISSERCAL